MLFLTLTISIHTTGYCNNLTKTEVKVPQRIVVVKKTTATSTFQPKADFQVRTKTSTTQPSANINYTVNSPTKTIGPAKTFSIKQPLPVKYMQPPDPQSFQAVVKADYHLSVPTIFGPNPLANLPGTDGPMLLRIQDNTLYMAVNVVDPNDAKSFNATKFLPNFEQKKIFINWLFGTQGQLSCEASEYNGFYGNTIIIEAKQNTNGKTYELLYSFPTAKVFDYLPTVLYSLNSFKPN